MQQRVRAKKWSVIFLLIGISFMATACFDRTDSVSSGEAINLSQGLATRGEIGFGPNARPSISGSPARIIQTGQKYFFQANAEDPDGDGLGFSIRNKPDWARFDPTSGRLEGVPGEEDEGLFDDIVISVSDTKLGADLPSFDILVSESVADLGMGSPPVLAGNPPTTAVVNEPYAFEPSVSDDDGDLLIFEASNLPAWLLLNTSDGSFSGTPRSGDVGTHADIVISVSDGVFTDTMGPFAIEVSDGNAGESSRSVTLSWTVPSRNEAGTPLNDLLGYEIHFGRSPGTYDERIDIRDIGVTNYTVTGLSKGLYYFAVSAYNTLGAASDFSNEVMANLN